MTITTELSDANFVLFAAQHYTNPRVLNVNEFHSDLAHIRYIKRLLNRYMKKQILQERLILNHIITFFNVFEYNAAIDMCFFKLDYIHHSAFKTFLMYLNYVDNSFLINTPSDLYVAKKLSKI